MPLQDGAWDVEGEARRLDRVVRDGQQGASWEQVRRAVRTGKVRVDGVVQREPGVKVAGGQRVELMMAAPREPRGQLGDDSIVFQDRHIVIVNKPPGLASVPDDRWRKNTLQQQIGERVRRAGSRPVPLGVVQRLDVGTSGLIVFTKTPEAYEELKATFKRREVERSYLALVAGKAEDGTHRSYLREHKNGKRSSTPHRHLGKYAVTHVEVVERLTGATLVRCRLETGRTHQIRIHLAEADHPLLGDTRYFRRRVPTPEAPRVMLHAAELGFTHPITGRRIHHEMDPPEDMRGVIARLRGKR